MAMYLSNMVFVEEVSVGVPNGRLLEVNEHVRAQLVPKVVCPC